jgi:hypothetical protein
MKKYLPRICVGLLLAGPLLMGGCAAYVGGGGAVNYDYDYYPDCDAYYYPHGHLYYWNEGGAWRSGDRLPDRYAGHAQHTEQIHLHSQQPWTEHRVEQRAAAQHHDEEHH